MKKVAENKSTIACSNCKNHIEQKLKENEAVKEREKLQLDNKTACKFCFGIANQILEKKEKIVSKIEKYKFNSFYVNCRFREKFEEATQLALRIRLKPNWLVRRIEEFINLEISRIIRKEVNKNDPELLIQLKLQDRLMLKVRSRSLFISGRYRKFVRGIPQTKWPCKKCKGIGCTSCNKTGLLYPISVEGLISEPFKKSSLAEGSKFHGAGREDIDVRMLGNGRPFVLELINPKLRNFELGILEDKINRNNRISVTGLGISSKSEIKILKEGSKDSIKTYYSEIEGLMDKSITQIKKSLDVKFPLVLKQQTPQRVLHRRSDLIRQKRIYALNLIGYQGGILKLEITAQGGTYIKEFISGDDNRTIPSVSQLIGSHCNCVLLDVTNIGGTS